VSWARVLEGWGWAFIGSVSALLPPARSSIREWRKVLPLRIRGVGCSFHESSWRSRRRSKEAPTIKDLLEKHEN